MVAAGNSINVEILDLINPEFKYEWKDERTYTPTFESAMGGLLKNKPLICTSEHGIIILGSSSSETLYPEETKKLLRKKYKASSVVLKNQEQLLITGGRSDPNISHK